MADRSLTPTTADGLDVHETEDGLVVYDQATDTVHHLNRTAAVVFGLCDGTRNAEAITGELGELFGLARPPLDEVYVCLDELAELGLIR